MKQIDLRPIILAAVMMVAIVSTTFASGMYWVVGNLVTNSCDIVSLDPVVGPEGPLWFGNGPHKSYDDARLARQSISACPHVAASR